jgi:O-antigen biosynthesis protein WbqP
MNLVGPRPALYNQYDLIALREKYGVHAVRPGLTGWAQVNGRDELPIPVKVEYDRYYVERRSLALDCRIIWMTVRQVLTSKGVVEGAGETKK